MACRCSASNYCDHYGRSFCNTSAICYQPPVVKSHKCSDVDAGRKKMKTINMMSLAKIIFTDTTGIEMVINVFSVKKVASSINHYNILGHNGNENCSGADVGIEFRSVPNACAKNKRHCCNLAGKDKDIPTKK